MRCCLWKVTEKVNIAKGTTCLGLVKWHEIKRWLQLKNEKNRSLHVWLADIDGPRASLIRFCDSNSYFQGFQKMHNISKRHIKLTKAYQIEPAKPRKAKLNFELIDDWVEKLKKAGQLNPLGWSCLWQYYSSWGSACCLYLLSRTIPQKWGTLQIHFYIYNFIRHFWIETWPTEAQRRQMPVKTFDNNIIKTNYGIDQYHRGWRFKICADYLFCSFDFFYFWSGKRRRRNWFSDLYVNKW